MKLIDQIINDIQTIDLEKRVAKTLEGEKGDMTRVSFLGSHFYYQLVFDYKTWRGTEFLYFNEDLILKLSMWKGSYDKRVIKETEDGFFTFKGLDWSTTQFKGMEDFLSAFRTDE